MTTRDHLRALVEASEGASTVQVPRTWILELLGGLEAEDVGNIERTAEQVAEMLGRKPSTIRNHAARGAFPGAHKIMGEWRFPPESIRRFLQGGTTAPATTELGAWRRQAQPVRA